MRRQGTSRPEPRIAAILAVILGFLGTTSFAQLGPPPIIVVQPVGVSVSQGGTATFTVVATSLTAMTYKWYRDGHQIASNDTRITGSTNSILTLRNIQNGDKGNYTVQIANASGTTTSSNAALLVVTALLPVELPIAQARMTPSGFNLNLTNLTVSRCVFYASSDLTNWIPISTNNVSSGSVNFTDVAALNLPFRYYKAMDQ